jgi:hypothetical protein
MAVRASSLARWVNQDSSVELPPLDLTPVFSAGRTLSGLVRDRWRRVRDQALDRAGHACEVCGQPPLPNGSHAERHLHVHEAWRYDLSARVQWLERLWVLCYRCHHLTHGKPSWCGQQPQQAQQHWFAMVARARLEAEPSRLLVFTIDLQRGREPVPDTLAAAFARADHATLPARIRAVVHGQFDVPLAAALGDEPFAYRPHVDAAQADDQADDLPGMWAGRRSLAGLLTDRAAALAQPQVLAALLEPGHVREVGPVPRRASRHRRHTYAQWPPDRADGVRARWHPPPWPRCHGCGRVQPQHEPIAGSWSRSTQTVGSLLLELLWCPACQVMAMPATAT